MFNNPLIKRYRLSAMRPTQVIIYIAIYLVILMLIGILNEKSTGFSTQMFKNIYCQLIIIQAMFLLAWSSFNSSSAIREEIVTNSYDFFKMLPLTAGQKTIGILIGKNLFVIILAAINFILMCMCGIIGEINFMLHLQIICVIIAFSIFLNSFGLMTSIQPDRKKTQSGIIGIVFVIFFFFPFLIGNAIDVIYDGKELEKIEIYFYDLEIPLLWIITLITLFYSCWMIKGTLRKFTYERSPLFTPFGAFLFMIGYGLIILGLFYNFLRFERYSGDVYVFGTVCFIPALLIPFMSRKTFENYIEHLGAKHLQSENLNLNTALLCYSNLLTGITLYLVWAVFAFMALWITKTVNAYNIMVMLSYFASYLFVILMLELFNVLSPSVKKIGILLGFVFGLYAFLPLILAGVLDNEQLVKYSPFGLIGMLIDSDVIQYKFMSIFIIYNIVISLLPVFFIVRRYLYIVQARKQMLLS